MFLEESRMLIPRVWVALEITIQNRFRGMDFGLGAKGCFYSINKKTKPEIVLS